MVENKLNQNVNSKRYNSIGFWDNIIVKEDPDKKIIVSFQNQLDKEGINKDNIYLFAKDLTDTQKEKLLELYTEQITSLNLKINNCKNNILKIRRKLKV